jgi:hypothetical protein
MRGESVRNEQDARGKLAQKFAQLGARTAPPARMEDRPERHPMPPTAQ